MGVRSFAALLALAGLSNASWHEFCSVIQEGRIDPITSPGKAASYAYKISGPSNVGLSSTFDSLQTAKCTSCEIQADKSVYSTPILYYEHSNGSFEEVYSGTTVYYVGGGSTTNNTKPFPAGLRMLSGDPLVRSSKKLPSKYSIVNPTAGRVSFNCLGTASTPETPGISETNCVNGLRAQVHFQSCWNGVDLYKSDNSHVAYLSGIETGTCPPAYPVQFMHLYLEVVYSIANVKQDGGRFVFSNGDPTGYGFHGEFLNGWDKSVLTSAIHSCGANGTNPSGTFESCPAFTNNHAKTCPRQPPLNSEPVSGMIKKLPGCITITDGPGEATAADSSCAAEPSVSAVAKSTANTTIGIVSAGPMAGTLYYPVATSSHISYHIKSTNDSYPTTHQSIYARTTGAPTTLFTSIFTPSTTIAIITAAPSALPANAIEPVNGYVKSGCYKAAAQGSLVLNGGLYTDIESMDVQSCTSYCEARGLGIAGMQNSQECYCGATNHGVKIADASCDLPCRGNRTEICGGLNSLSIWESG